MENKVLYNMEPIPNDLERSLLQKAVRRGNVELIDKVVKYLISVGDAKWLRKRLAVIGYEECWTYADTLDYNCKDNKLLEQYKTLACKVKNKNCDGLAYLAKRLNEGEKTAETGNDKEKKAISSVANAIKKRDQFWEWIKKHPNYEKNKYRIEAAKKATTKPHLKKDQVIMLAAAYLSVTYPIPDTEDIEPNNDPNFPYWIAIDKHTAIGVEFYNEACKKINIMPSRGRHIGFYLEGSVCNKIKDSDFFELSKIWQLDHMGYTLKQAEDIWKKLKPILIQETKLEAGLMQKRLNTIKVKNDGQGELF